MLIAFEAVLEDESRYNKISLQLKVMPVLIHCKEYDTMSEVHDYKLSAVVASQARTVLRVKNY